jgi:hypothetical protein
MAAIYIIPSVVIGPWAQRRFEWGKTGIYPQEPPAQEKWPDDI